MSYIQKTLMPNEKLIYHEKPHWFIYGSTALWLFLGFAIFLFGDRLQINRIPFADHAVYIILGGIFLLVALWQWIVASIFYYCAEYGITDKRVLMKYGFIRRHSLEIFLNKIESIQVEQGILGRVFNFGTLVVNGTGGTHDVFYKVPRPLQFRRKVQQQMAI